MIIADVAVARGVVIDRPLPERASGGDTLVDHVVAQNQSGGNAEGNVD